MNEVDNVTAAPGARECDGCTLCCKVLDIGSEGVVAPPGSWCQHCDKTGGGCQIYAQRPEECRQFACFWVQRDDVPESLKPSKCRVVIGWAEEMFQLYVDPGRPEAWQQAQVRGWIEAMTRQGAPIAVSINGRVIWANDQARSVAANRQV